jgi:hypothetical protein
LRGGKTLEYCVLVRAVVAFLQCERRAWMVVKECLLRTTEKL